MNTTEAITTRRSTRAYRPDAVEDEKLAQIIQAGRVAPCGGNSQTTHFLVIRNRRILEELAAIVCGAFAAMEIVPDMYKSLKASVLAAKKGGYVFHYNAPILIVTANKKAYGNAMADCACAVENMMLAANELDLGSCWINQLHWLDENPTVRSYMLKLGLGEDETICAAVSIGKPDTKTGLPVREPRTITGNPVEYIDEYILK